MGFDNSIANVSYPNGYDGPILRAPSGDPLSVTLTGFTPGNLILAQLAISGTDGIASGPTGSAILVSPRVNLGAGNRTMHQSGSALGIAGIGLSGMQALAWTSFVVPVAVEVTAAPVISFNVFLTFNDPMDLFGYAVLMYAAEIDIATVVQLPSTFLDP
jgi:hypothetical protein